MGTAWCDLRARTVPFLVSSRSSSCYWNKPFNITAERVLRSPTGEEIELTVVQMDERYLNTSLSRLEYVFYYNASSALVNATLRWQQSEAETDGRVTNYEGAECKVSVTFVNADAPPRLPKSGSKGYAFDQPVIAGYQHNDTLIVQNNLAGTFPIPFGYDCGNVEYTPLLFGVETVAGCSNQNDPTGDENMNLSIYTHIAIHGVANPNSTFDWVRVNDQCSLATPLFQRYIFFYETFGEVRNAQHRITSVIRQCTGAAQPEGPRIISASFLQVANKDPQPFLPPNPRLPGIPRDTWYPFGSSAGTLTKSTTAALVWGVMIVSALLFAV
jgi:hypothetical protein